MSERLSSLDVSFLYLESAATPMHVGGLLTFARPEHDLEIEALADFVTARIAAVPRYRQRIRWVPGHLANPVWVDDPDFDPTYHIRRSALPGPGTDAQLRDLAARIISRPLDRSRPLWELYIVEGLAGGRFAMISKTHHAMVDGVSAVDIGQLIFDATPEPRPAPPDVWEPGPPPTGLGLVSDALSGYVRAPGQAVGAIGAGVRDVRRVADRAVGRVAGVGAMLRTAIRPAPSSVLNVRETREGRRLGTAVTSLDDHKLVRKTHGGTINDVVLTTVAGALRAWLLFRGEPVVATTSVRALVPISVRAEDEPVAAGNQVAGFLVDLPVGEASAVVRHQQVAYTMTSLKAANQFVGATTMLAAVGFSPPTLHQLGARVADGMSSRFFNTVITNVPGPQFPLYADGARMLDCFPVVPLAQGQAVAFGVTSYDGKIFYGLNAEREAMPDIDILAALIEESLEELVEVSR